MESYSFVIVGGGIAGVSCAEGLAFLCPDKQIILITASPVVKAVSNVIHLTKTLCEFDVKELKTEQFADSLPTVSLIQDTVTSINTKEHTVCTSSGKCMKYEKICICTGGSPKLIVEDNPFVLGIRDTESVKEFETRIKGGRRIVVVGNGGIATELVHEVQRSADNMGY
jgi:small subunit ribosomal protein S18b